MVVCRGIDLSRHCKTEISYQLKLDTMLLFFLLLAGLFWFWVFFKSIEFFEKF